MSDERRQFDALRPLLIGLTDDQLDSEQREQLAALLREDPAARTYYLQYMLTDAMLRLEHSTRELTCEEGSGIRGQRSGISSLPSPASGRGAGGEDGLQRNRDNDLQPIPNPPIPISIILDPAPFAPVPSPLYVTHPFLFSNLFALFVLCLGIFGAWMYQIDIPQPIARHGRTKASTYIASDTKASEFIGQITGMSNTITWLDESTSTVSGARVPLGRRYALASGLLEITYDSGAKVVLQGPATYEVESRDGGFLSRGKLTARLEKGSEGLGTGGGKGGRSSKLPSPASGRGVGGEGGQQQNTDGNRNQLQHALTLALSGHRPQVGRERGPNTDPQSPNPQISNSQSPIPNPSFTVRTPSASVTDLGTEFGVFVQDASTCNVHVFEGKVQVALPSINGAPACVRQLTAGQMTQITNGKIHSIAASGLQPMKVVHQRLHPNGFHVGMNDGFADISLQDAALCVERSLGASQRLRLSWNDFGHVGSAWHVRKQSVAQGFRTGFQFQFAYPQGVGGDGLAFVVQNTPQAEKLRVGVNGSPKNALNVSIHSYQNAGDPSNAFLVVCDGSKSLGTFDLHPRSGLASLADGRVHTLQIDYSPGSLDVHFDYVQVIKNLKVNLAKLEHGSALDSDGKAWIGFAASTGEMARIADKNHTENHDILSWTYLPIGLGVSTDSTAKP